MSLQQFVQDYVSPCKALFCTNSITQRRIINKLQLCIKINQLLKWSIQINKLLKWSIWINIRWDKFKFSIWRSYIDEKPNLLLNSFITNSYKWTIIKFDETINNLVFVTIHEYWKWKMITNSKVWTKTKTKKIVICRRESKLCSPLKKMKKIAHTPISIKRVSDQLACNFLM